jgi:hypothetical protein
MWGAARKRQLLEKAIGRKFAVEMR